ncbi:hypothetical protein PVK06_008403 [Gossypium arboreum]|uniref:DUF4283 domain-containing protein n=1 Tax=Gossypium arboreum TaxID=29729 RepID=A0ABR0QJU1_GOSAR|nr:hypothetical protein PVK06_008403 [Gossypium arboreum]
MDIENGYFLAKFQNKEDYEKVLSHGPWVMYGQYLTMQPWTIDFSSLQLYPSIVITWIRLSSLSGYMYKRRIIEEIEDMVGKVVKLDYNTNSRTKGRFAHMAVGPYFTWHRGGIFERLDRALSNDPWVKAFPNSMVTYLLKINSDHKPLLLSSRPVISSNKGRPFGFFGWVN